MNNEDESIVDKSNVDLQKKYLLSWASGRIRSPNHFIAELKNNLITEFSSILDQEKFQLYVLCADARNYLNKL